jgi:3(or 17)beta-hydroxysteroid dehydrogenase
LDVLVNNAGIAHIANIESASTDQWHDILRVHLDGTFFGCRSAIPEMTKSGSGSIINMSSIAALVGLSSYLAYSTAKGGIRSMTKSIAIYCREQKNNIRCNSIHPGSISTPMVHAALETLSGINLMEQEDPEATRKAMGIGEPLDVANMVLFLASEESKHVNGAELVIDNGATVAQMPR